MGPGRERRPTDRQGPGALTPGLRTGGVAALLLVVLVFGPPALARAGSSEVAHGAGWLRSVQNADGGFGSSPGDDSGAAMTGWAMLGFEAAGINPLDVADGGRTPVDFLRGTVEDLKSPGDLARTILALEGAGVDPRQFAGANLVFALLDKRRDNGSFEGWPGSTAYGVIALRTAGATGGLEKSLSWLQKVQNDDGGWGDEPGTPSTADGTGAVMQALSPESKAAHRGLSYLRDAQRPGGGFALGGNYAVNTQSTAWAIQGILATGGDPSSFRRGGSSAPDYLSAEQQSDGHYRYSQARNQTPIWVTAQVLVAAAGDYLPIAPPPREPQPAQSQAQTGGVVPSATNPTGSAPSTSAGASPSVSGASSVPPPVPGPGMAGPSRTFCDPRTSPPPGAGRRRPTRGARGGGVPTSDLESVAPEESTEDDSSSSTAGAVVLGLLAGCLLFAAALGARHLWMRQRYGL